MKTLNIALVAFAVVSTLATSAFARDGVSTPQGATASYGQDTYTQSVAQPAAPTAALSDAESITILHNVSKFNGR